MDGDEREVHHGRLVAHDDAVAGAFPEAADVCEDGRVLVGPTPTSTGLLFSPSETWSNEYEPSAAVVAG